jgi:dolichyl-phosphate beta-glucosyltransferase
MKSLSVIIPCYNEEERIGKTLKRMKQFLKKYDYEIIVSDDGSTDNTRAIAQKAGVTVLPQKRNRGKGYAVKKGMLAAKKEWVLFSDADLSTPIEEVDKLFINQPVVFGSRGLKKSDIRTPQPFYRVFAGKVFNLLVQATIAPGIWDTQCGFKLFKRTAARKIFSQMTVDGFGFDLEITFLACKLKYVVQEIPIVWYNDPRTKVKFLRDSTRMFLDIARIHLNHFRGRYTYKL